MPNVARKQLLEARSQKAPITWLPPRTGAHVLGLPGGRQHKASPPATQRAIADIRLDEVNPGKRDSLAAVAMEYTWAVQRYIDHLVEPDAEGSKFGAIPDISSALSERWKRCAWQQACGTVQSWRSNGRDQDGSERPTLRGIAIQANANVAVLELSKTAEFDFWLRVSTLEARQVVRIPVKVHAYGRAVLKEALDKGGWISTSTLLRFQRGKRPGSGFWTLQITANTPLGKAMPYDHVRGADAGLASVLTDDRGTTHGTFRDGFKARVEQAAAKLQRKQKLNACLRAINERLAASGSNEPLRPLVAMHDGRVQREARNAIGAAVNAFVDSLQDGEAVARERLSVFRMRMKSRAMNRYLKAGQIGYVADLLERRLAELRIPDFQVNPAYTSQRCPECGFFHRANRPNQATFHCLWCGYTAHADANGARNIRERFLDVVLNSSSLKQVETILFRRFLDQNGLPGARSASAGLAPIPCL